MNTAHLDDPEDDDYLLDIDFSKGMPNPYASRFTSTALVVRLLEELRREFLTAESIEEALEMLLEIRKTLARSGRQPGTPPANTPGGTPSRV